MHMYSVHLRIARCGKFGTMRQRFHGIIIRLLKLLNVW